MASSNRHWPSMFKSKPCNSHHQHHQWQSHEINPNSNLSNGCHRSPFANACDERSPEPKPRWNPKPEQIKILEAIFNSGMVNPPRDEIRKIRTQLQEYGQVGDANVFYWFQNRKSRSKHKLKLQQNAKQQQPPPTTVTTTTVTTTTASPSSSSSDKSSTNVTSKSTNKKKTTSAPVSLNSPDQVLQFPQPNLNHQFPQPNLNQTGSFGQFFDEPSFLGGGFGGSSQGISFYELTNMVNPHQPQQQHHQQVLPGPGPGPCTSLLLSEILNTGDSILNKENDHDKGMKIIQQPQLGYGFTPNISASAAATIPSTINQIQGIPHETFENGPRSTVFINDVAFDVASGPFNVKEAFGDYAVLINSSGQPLITNQWGVTLQSLQHGAFYYLI